MRIMYSKIFIAIVMVAVVSALLPMEAVACPNGYFQCGRVCCPGR
jgi:hypothetical protein